MLRVSRMQAVNYRLVVNNLSTPSAGWLICRGRVRRVAGHRTPWRSARPARSGGGVRAGRVAAFAPGPDLQPSGGGVCAARRRFRGVYSRPVARDSEARQVLEDLAEEPCAVDFAP